jgi:CubicO group peptidase (beta-lactamase class C family)
MKHNTARFKFWLGSVVIGVATLFPFQSMQAANLKHKTFKTQALTTCTLKPQTTTAQAKTKSTHRVSTRPSVRPSTRPSIRPLASRNSTSQPSLRRQAQTCTIFKPLDSANSAYQAAIDYSQANGEDGLLIMQGGTTIFERYTAPFSDKIPHYLESGTKSFSGVIAIAAAQDGLLNLDERVSNTITEWQSDANKAPITVRQLLSLTSGIAPGTVGQIPTYAQSLNTGFRYPTGTSFLYGPTGFQVFGALMQRKLTPQAIGDPVAYLQQRVLTPIGVQVKQWGRLSDGNPNMSSGAGLTAQEWAKFGTLLKQNGQWQGQQILDASLVSQLFSSSSVNPAYGMTFWLNAAGIDPSYRVRAAFPNLPSNTFMAEGGQGQRLIVIPSRNLIIVRFGNSDTFTTAGFVPLLPSS